MCVLSCRGTGRDSRCFREVSDAEQPAAPGMRGPAEPPGPGVHILVPRQPDDQLRHRPGSERHVRLTEQAQRTVHRTRVPLTFRQLHVRAEQRVPRQHGHTHPQR